MPQYAQTRSGLKMLFVWIHSGTQGTEQHIDSHNIHTHKKKKIMSSYKQDNRITENDSTVVLSQFKVSHES